MNNYEFAIRRTLSIYLYLIIFYYFLLSTNIHKQKYLDVLFRTVSGSSRVPQGPFPECSRTLEEAKKVGGGLRRPEKARGGSRRLGG